MKKLLIPAMFFYTLRLLAQQPYVMDGSGQGLGQYGYIELGANSFVQMNSNTFNVKDLAARWWTGSEYIYNSTAGSDGGCPSGLTRLTNDFNSGNHPNWNAGTTAYVSVRFRDCSNNWNGTNYNERQFLLIDIDNTYGGAFDNSLLDNPTGTDNIVGSATINAGMSRTLDRFWIYNSGTALEGSDITNGGVRIYYEAITGSETFDGTESYAQLFGDYGGNSTSNGQWGHDNLNIPVPAAGIRIYVVVSDLASGYTAGRTVLFRTLNDGISFEQTINGKNLVRTGEFDLSSSASQLPVSLASFEVHKLPKSARLHWTTLSERNNDRFEVERATDGKTWKSIASVPSQNPNSTRRLEYSFEDTAPDAGSNYYRLRQIDFDGTQSISKVVKTDFGTRLLLSVSPNPAQNDRVTIAFGEAKQNLTVQILDAQGRLLRAWTHHPEDAPSVEADLSSFSGNLFFVKVGDEVVKIVR
jgi:hypothetical protein